MHTERPRREEIMDATYFWEPKQLHGRDVAQAGRLYERTLDADERIPWAWIRRGAGTRPAGGWARHLLLAGRPGNVLGFAYGAYIPNFGGYICYVGVDGRSRGKGVGTGLYYSLFDLFRRDAARAGETLPFVVWESYKPNALDSAKLHDTWQARVRLFGKVGGLAIKGLKLRTPNYADPDAGPVPLRVFVKPMDRPRRDFGPVVLKRIAAGLLERVYKLPPDDPRYLASLAPPKLKLVAPRVRTVAA
jgi:GNAT superfamily N-acetyltransferase